MATTIKPLEDRVLVQPLEAEQTTASGLVIPDTAKEKPQEGKVVATGPGRVDDSGKRVPMDVAELLISPEGIPGWLPAARSWTYLWVILGWLVSSAVMLCARHWVGAVSAAWLFIMSSIGSVSLLKRGHAILGTLELVVCVVGLGALLLAVAAGAFRRRGGEMR